MIGARIGHSLDPFLLRVYHLFLPDRSINPNIITIVALFFSLVCVPLVILDRHVLAGTALLVSGFFDILDGAVARQTGRVTPYGGFLDSVLDRYADLAVAFAVFIYFTSNGDTLWAIAQKFGVAVADLCRWNGIRDPRRHKLQVGRELVVYPQIAPTASVTSNRPG